MRFSTGAEKGTMNGNSPAIALSATDNPIISKEKKVPNVVPSRNKEISGKR